MKFLLPLLLPALLAVGARPDAPPATPPAHACTFATDDPPSPDPIGCPLCGGNAQLHLSITKFLIDRATTNFMTRWLCRT